MAKKRGYLLTKKEKLKVLYKILLLFIPILIVSSAFVVILLRVQLNSEIEGYFNFEKYIVEFKQRQIQEELFYVAHDLNLLLSNKQLLKIADEELKDEAIAHVVDDYKELSGFRRCYDQIRFIDTNGMELIRVNYKNGNSYKVPKDKLQNKRNRYYFTEAIALDKKEVYFSPMDLNVENGEIEQPLKPMLRVGAPVFNEKNEKTGVVFLNYYTDKIVGNIMEEINPQLISQIMLLNSAGYFLKGPNEDVEWGFMYEEKKDQVFSKYFKDAWLKIGKNIEGQFINEEGLFSHLSVYPLELDTSIHQNADIKLNPEKMRYFPENYEWKIVSFVPSSVLYASAKERIRIAVFIMIIYIILLLLAAVRYFKLQCVKLESDKKISDSNKRFISTLDSVDAAIYVADMNTYEILFANKYVTRAFGEITGKICYSTLQIGQNSPCSFCTNHLLLNDRGEPKEPYIWEYYNPKIKRWYQIHDTAIRWSDGRIVRLETAFDITDRKEMELALINSERRLREAQETAHIGHWEYNHTTKEFIWSDEVLRILDVDLSDFKFTPDVLIERIHPDDRQKVIDAYELSLKSKKTYDIVHRINQKNGGYKYVKAHCYHSFDKRGKPALTFGTISDISSLVEKEHKIVQQNEELKILNANKDKLLSILSHDLRSPMGGFMQLIDLMLHKIDSLEKAKTEKLLKAISRSSRRIFLLLEDLLAWSKVQTNKLDITKDNVELNILIDKTIALYENNASEKNIAIVNKVGNKLMAYVDKDLVYTVFRNIISNAIKFTDKNGVVSISANSQNNIDNSKFVVVSVQDTGIGMSQDEINNLFLLDKKKTTKGTAGETGTGLGLTLSHDLVKENGGELKVSSTKGEGTTFSIILPAGNPEAVDI